MKTEGAKTITLKYQQDLRGTIIPYEITYANTNRGEVVERLIMHLEGETHEDWKVHPKSVGPTGLTISDVDASYYAEYHINRINKDKELTLLEVKVRF